eukprot:6198091-Pleurochrysis_carterae.AAC.1
MFRQYTDIRRITYFVGIALNVTPLAEVNIEEYYLAVNSNPIIGLRGLMYPIGYSWLRPVFTSTSSTQQCTIHTK